MGNADILCVLSCSEGDIERFLSLLPSVSEERLRSLSKELLRAALSSGSRGMTETVLEKVGDIDEDDFSLLSMIDAESAVSYLGSTKRNDRDSLALSALKTCCSAAKKDEFLLLESVVPVDIVRGDSGLFLAAVSGGDTELAERVSSLSPPSFDEIMESLHPAVATNRCDMLNLVISLGAKPRMLSGCVDGSSFPDSPFIVAMKRRSEDMFSSLVRACGDITEDDIRALEECDRKMETGFPNIARGEMERRRMMRGRVSSSYERGSM